jgi:hypothetical protein
MLLSIAACGGGGSGSGGTTVTQPPPVVGGSEDIGATVATQALGDWLAEGLAYADRDGDGLQDQNDAWPDNPTILADPSSGQSLTITRAWTDVDGHRVLGTAVEGRELSLEVSGLPSGSGEPIWIVFKTNDGLRAVEAISIGANTLSVANPYPEASGAHIVVGALRGIDYPVYSIRMEQAVLFAPQSIVAAGAPLTLQGRNLDRIEQVMLGNDALTIESASPNEITVRAPSAASSNLLYAQSSLGRSNRLSLDLRRNVEIRVAADLELAQQATLRTWIAGAEVQLSPAQAVTISVPAWRPEVLSFDIIDNDEVRSHGRLRAVVWPGDNAAEVSTHNSLLGRMINMRQWLPDADGSDWAQLRGALNRVLNTQAAQDYLVAVVEHTSGRAGAPHEPLVSAAVQAYIDLADQAATTAASEKETAAVALAPSTPWGALDGVVASTLVSLSQGSADKDAEGQDGGFAYPPQELTQIFGSDYSFVSIMRHDDLRGVTPDFRFLVSCSYSNSEKSWRLVRMASADEWKRVWDSDLCLQVDGVIFISAAVVMPGFKSAVDIFNQIATSPNSSPKELLRRHSKANRQDSSYQLGKGGYYLRSDAGMPLCHMETCYIEVITSGYGAYSNVALTTSQANLVKTMRTRMWVEGLIPWMVSLVGNASANTQAVKDCLRAEMLKDGTFYDAVDAMTGILVGARDMSGSQLEAELNKALDQKLAPWARQFVQSQIGGSFSTCVGNLQAMQLTHEAVREKLLEISGLSTFANVLAFVTNLGSAVLTPEKFVFKIQYRAEITSVSPKEINLYDESAQLRIKGDWLIDTPCGSGWCPELVIEDQLENSVTIPLDESHNDPPGNCGAACTGLSIPFSELGALQGLRAGPIDVELAIADADYTSYPGNKLRITVPGNVMTLQTKAKLVSVHPPLAQGGETVTATGTGLSAYGALAIYKLVPTAGGNGITMQKIGNDNKPDAVALLTVPNVVAGNYRVVIEPGTNATEKNLQPLQSESQLLISTGGLQLVMVGEQGITKDDSLHVRLLDRNNNVVQRTGSLESLEFYLPDSESNYVDGVSWDDAQDENANYSFISARVSKIRVICDNSGSDDTCTFGVRSLIDGICLTQGSTPAPAKVGKIPHGEQRDYYLTPDGAPCSDADFP